MAVSSTSATRVYISHTRDSTAFISSHRREKLTAYTSHFIRLPKQRSEFSVKTSGDAPQVITSGEATQEAGEDEKAESSSVEATTVPYSLISALNVQKAMRGIAITDADHYGRLGIQRDCPYEQVPIVYKMRCEELINKGLEEEELSKKLELLKESYMILSSEEERRLYDWSISRSDGSDKYVWPFEVDMTQTPTRDPPPQEPEDPWPSVLIGYFMLGWFVLGATLSIAFNK